MSRKTFAHYRTVIYAAFIVSLCVGAFVFPFFPASVAHADSNGRISGQLLNGTNNNAVVAGQSVTLQISQGNSAKDLNSVITDAQGNFSFDHLATDNTNRYALYSLYQGAQYYTDLISLSDKPQQQPKHTQHKATSSNAKLLVVLANVLIQQSDTQKGVLKVSELYLFKNIDTRTYVGSLDASQGRPNALLFSLPSGARNITLDKGFEGYQTIAIGSGFATNTALLPGDSEFAFSFEIPYSTSTYDFKYTVLLPTLQLEVLIPTNMHGSSSGLSTSGIVTSNQHPYYSFIGKQLSKDTQVHLNLEGLPVSTNIIASTSSALNPIIFWLLMGGLIVLVVLLIVWLIYRLIRQPASTPQKSSSDQRKKEVASGSTKATAPQTSTEKEQQDLLQQLLKLDKAFEAGKLEKKEYDAQRIEIKAQLRAMMGEAAMNRAVSDIDAQVQSTTAPKAKVTAEEEKPATNARAKTKTPAEEEKPATSTHAKTKAPAEEEKPATSTRTKSKAPAEEEKPATSTRTRSKAPTEADKGSDTEAAANEASPGSGFSPAAFHQMLNPYAPKHNEEEEKK